MPYIGFSNVSQQQYQVFENPDINGTKLKLDADGDTSITSDTDDQIDIEISGADDFQFTANTFTAQSGSTIAAQALTATTGVFSSTVSSNGFNPDAADGAALGSASLEFSDLYLADGGIIYLGNDQDVTVTHVADTAIQVNKDVHAESFNLPITLNGTDGSSTHAGDNIILDASAASTDVGERLLYEGIPETAITALGGDVVGADNTVSRINLKDYGEITTAIGNIGGGTQNLDLELGNNFTATVNSATTTFQFTHPTASDELCGFTLFLTNGGSQTVNWPGGVDWAGGTAPTLTTSGLDILVFITTDGGTIWHGMVGSADSK